MATKKKTKKTIAYSLYQVYRPRAKAEYRYSPPLVGLDDEHALEALIILSKSQPELQRSYLYQIGKYYPLSGKITLGVRRLVQPKKETTDEN